MVEGTGSGVGLAVGVGDGVSTVGSSPRALKESKITPTTDMRSLDMISGIRIQSAEILGATLLVKRRQAHRIQYTSN